MVLSKVEDVGGYPILKRVQSGDFTDLSRYQMRLLDIDVVVVVGNSIDTHDEKNLLYYPVYLVKYNDGHGDESDIIKEDELIPIGVYKIKATELMNYVDSANNLDVEYLDDPILYGFVTKDMLNEYHVGSDDKSSSESDSDSESENDKSSSEDEEDKKDKDKKDKAKMDKSDKKVIDVVDSDSSLAYSNENTDIFTLSPNAEKHELLVEESEADAKYIVEKYKAQDTDPWIAKYMKNNNYVVVDNEGGGDCFFATIRDAFASISMHTTIAKLRSKLAGKITQETFNTYREHYDMYNREINDITKNIKDLEAQYKRNQDLFASITDRNERTKLMENAKEIQKKHTEMSTSRKFTSSLQNEYKFMKNVDTPDALRDKIKTSEYWADTMAVSTFERLLNIKFVILSSEAYEAGDMKNVMLCGQLNDSYLENKGIFTPDYYIMIDYNGMHYKTIGYKSKMIFKFSEIPFDVKRIIVDKCMEKNAGPFSLIPDFRKLKLQQGVSVKSNEQSDLFNESRLRGLYEDDIIFMFYSHSNDAPNPGKGNGEKIAADRITEFVELKKHKQWRRKLDNSWISPFKLHDHTWASVEHYYQASKFKQNSQDFYLSFSLDSKTDLSKDVEMAKAAGSNKGKYKGVLLRPVQVEIDPDFYKARNKSEIVDAIEAKFTQDEELQKILKATKRAKLTHYVPKTPQETCDDLMLLRDRLNKK